MMKCDSKSFTNFFSNVTTIFQTMSNVFQSKLSFLCKIHHDSQRTQNYDNGLKSHLISSRPDPTATRKWVPHVPKVKEELGRRPARPHRHPKVGPLCPEGQKGTWLTPGSTTPPPESGLPVPKANKQHMPCLGWLPPFHYGFSPTMPA